jgi:integrase
MKPLRIRFSHGEMQTRIIPETVLDQLRSHLIAFPDDLRRMVVLLLESGIRVSELCCLSYDCLEIHADGRQFLQYQDRKLGRGRNILLSPLAVEAIMEQQQALGGREKGENHYLFPNQQGHPSSPQSFIKKLNHQATEKHICDVIGNVWRFQTHQIRTTVLWQVLNSPLHHVTPPLVK